MRLVLATEAEASVWRISGFSFSRLKDFGRLFLSFLFEDDLRRLGLLEDDEEALGPLRIVGGPDPDDTETV